MNFLSYHSLKLKLTAFHEFEDMPAYRDFLPMNNPMNILLNNDSKGGSNLYRKLLGQNGNVLFEMSEKWEDKAGIELNSHDISRSFSFHNII